MCLPLLGALQILQSFLPPSGRIKRVTVYLSDFGKERLQEEARKL